MQGSMVRILGCAGVVLGALGLTGCGPEFTTPIAWGESSQFVSSTYTEDRIGVELYEGGRGYVSNMPQGKASKTSKGNHCVDLSTDARYTGDIRWKATGENTFEVNFADSRYVVSGDIGKFGSQNWTLLQFSPCDGTHGFWQVGYRCGDPGVEGVVNMHECTRSELHRAP